MHIWYHLYDNQLEKRTENKNHLSVYSCSVKTLLQMCACNSSKSAQPNPCQAENTTAHFCVCH